MMRTGTGRPLGVILFSELRWAFKVHVSRGRDDRDTTEIHGWLGTVCLFREKHRHPHSRQLGFWVDVGGYPCALLFAISVVPLFFFWESI
jgi:hypothetical protein